MIFTLIAAFVVGGLFRSFFDSNFARLEEWAKGFGLLLVMSVPLLDASHINSPRPLWVTTTVIIWTLAFGCFSLGCFYRSLVWPLGRIVVLQKKEEAEHLKRKLEESR